MEQTTDTLQAYIERWAEGTYLQWKFEDAAKREWDVEWVYLFILAFILYIAAAAINMTIIVILLFHR